MPKGDSEKKQTRTEEGRKFYDRNGLSWNDMKVIGKRKKMYINPCSVLHSKLRLPPATSSTQQISYSRNQKNKTKPPPERFTTNEALHQAEDTKFFKTNKKCHNIISKFKKKEMVSTLEKLGMVSICFLALNFTRILYDYIQLKSVEEHYKNSSLKDLGQWGIVLGADKSIGQAYALELAKQGLNVVLIGDNMSKLKSLSSLLEKYFQVFTGFIALTHTANEFKYIEKALYNLDTAVLVNAPDYGEGLTQPEYFLNIPHLDKTLSYMFFRNLMIVTKMCAIVLPGMVSKGKGIIVNVSSIASKTSCPLLSLYGASAAYVEKLSQELRNEYSSSGVIVQTLLPGYVLNNGPNVKKKSWIMPSPKDYVGSAVRRLWVQGETSGYTPHSIIHGVLLRIQSLCPKTTANVIRKMMEYVRDGSLVNFLA